ncbi:MAG: hypothetical protein GF353_28380 [Candidatus Lokiarchaeota archaeon]|nr:hypothetical protein [Candidatus Lokiarchaeota archaeon]
MVNVEKINDKEKLYRAIHPIFWKNDLNKPSTAAFKDSKGVSVDRDGGREEKEVIAVFDKKKPNYGLASITAKSCREIGTHPIPKPLDDNIYHAEIHDSEDKIRISMSKLKKIIDSIYIVEEPNF